MGERAKVVVEVDCCDADGGDELAEGAMNVC